VQAPALPQGFELPLDTHSRRISRVGSVDQVGADARAGVYVEVKTVWHPVGV